jgi:hypothetical protein
MEITSHLIGALNHKNYCSVKERELRFKQRNRLLIRIDFKFFASFFAVTWGMRKRIHSLDAVKKATCNDLLSIFCSMSHEIYINLITHLLADARASRKKIIDIKLMFGRARS